tara:strand:- start:12681 stop:13289 length:609 start_codon:yes stop_codon:yes gene_type:complete
MKLLHVGCGQSTKAQSTDIFSRPEWEETRLDIDENVNPDIVSSITDMSVIEDDSFDAVYSSHNIEHLYAHEVPLALNEFRRVLNDKGTVFIRCPDLETIAQFIVDGKAAEPMYQSPAGPVAPIDALFGMRSFLIDNEYMAHKIAFTAALMNGTLKGAGFKSVYCVRMISAVELFTVASTYQAKEGELEQLMKDHLRTRLGNN